MTAALVWLGFGIWHGAWPIKVVCAGMLAAILWTLPQKERAA
jgi:hypothetical protein